MVKHNYLYYFSFYGLCLSLFWGGVVDILNLRQIQLITCNQDIAGEFMFHGFQM